GPFETLAGDGIDAGIGRGGDDLVAAPAQDGDGLRADQAGTADDDDLHGLPSLVDDWRRITSICPSLRAICVQPQTARSNIGLFPAEWSPLPGSEQLTAD